VRLDEEELKRWGVRIGQTVDAPVVIALSGPLGAGKSVLARAIGSGCGVDEAMPSPSYNLLLRYPAGSGRDVVHLDLYRLESPDELWELGWSQLGDDPEVVLIEWPERAGSLMPPDHWVIELSVPAGEPDLRDVGVRRVGSPPELASFPMSVSSGG
jgi:tRNA threonylcarbamoyladenosine biosynthesis protein TsaE